MQDWRTIPNVQDTLPWHKDKGRMKLNFFLSIIFVGMVLNGYDGVLISGLQAFDSWKTDLGLTGDNKNAPALLGFLNASGMISGFIVGPVITWIDERLGRKWGIRFYGYTILAGTVISCIAGVSGAHGMKGYGLFVAGRFMIGFGLASFLMTSLVVVQEITHPRSRSFIAQSWNSYYILGMVLGSWVNFGCSYLVGSWGWRLPYLLQAPMALYVLIAVQFVPETPRWLISKGRYEEGLQFLATYHGNGNPDDPLVRFQYEEMVVALEAEHEAQAEKWSTILRSPTNRHRLGLAALMTHLTIMSGSSVIYYYYSIVFDLVGITGASTQTGIAAGLNMFCWASQITAVWTGKRVGRKTIILWVWPMLLLGLIGLTATGGVFANSGSESRSAAVGTVVMVWVFLGAFNFANPVLYSYPAEVQTFSMRSKGLLVWSSITQIQSVYVVFVDAIALNAIGYKYYAVYIPLVVIQWFLTYFFMVETHGYTLEEVALAFDSQTSLVPHAAEEGRSGPAADSKSEDM